MSDIVNTTEYAELANAVQAIKGAILQSQQRALAAIKQEHLPLIIECTHLTQTRSRKTS